MFKDNYDDLTGRYITRYELIEARSWGRLALEIFLGSPEFIYHGEPLYSLSYVKWLEAELSPSERGSYPVEEMLCQLVDAFDVVVDPPNEYELFSLSSLNGMLLSVELLGGSPDEFPGMSLNARLQAMMLEKLVYSHTNFAELIQKLSEAGFEGGEQVEFYLIARIRRALLTRYPWLTEARQPIDL